MEQRWHSGAGTAAAGAQSPCGNPPVHYQSSYISSFQAGQAAQPQPLLGGALHPQDLRAPEEPTPGSLAASCPAPVYTPFRVANRTTL